MLHDITSEYITHVIQRSDISRYENAYPSLFNHYKEYWSGANVHKETSIEDIQSQTRLIRSRLPIIFSNLQKIGLNGNEVDLVLFVGRNASNGHAFRDNDKFIVWIPVETYHTELQADIFITHEIVHALHYQNIPEFYFSSLEEKHSFSRQIISEGLATYISMIVAQCDEPNALWADYLSQSAAQHWLGQCDALKKELFRYTYENFYSSPADNDFFSTVDVSNIKRYRGGYYDGLRVIRHIAETNKYNANDLLTMNRQEIEISVYETLKKIVS
ncbi:MAG TPA: DUF2268 domain-containing putative Zn-dependent protease [Candidatus Kapabacteria bacterium]|nr:DUF2268 domain-containing putative Zn-dependent protease [Candidatus Kapabacteria bacterium]